MVLAIIGWLALVFVCCWASIAWYAFVRVALVFGGRWDWIWIALWGWVCAAGWCGIAWVAPFHITIS